MSAIALAALAATTFTSAGLRPPGVVVRALRAAAPPLTERIDVLSYRVSLHGDCIADAAEVVDGLEGSGQAMVRLAGRTRSGEPCEGWATVEVRIFGTVWVTLRPIPAGAPLAGSVRQVLREIPRGGQPIESLAGTEVAGQPLRAGRVLESSLLRRPGPRVGSRISVVLQAGGLRIQQVGSLVSCSNGRSCARLPSGKQVEGVLDGNQLLVEAL